MIHTQNLKAVKASDYDEVWVIVRNLKYPPQFQFEHVPELSPSWPLFKTYLDLKASYSWGKDAFENIYKPRFIKQMQRLEAQEMLNKLCELDKAGKKICLVCFCDDAELCHRSIIADLLIEKGYNVVKE